MQASIICRIETRLAHYRLRLFLPGIVDYNSSTDSAAVRFRSHQLYFQPVVIAANVISQQGRRLVEIDDKNVDIAVVVEISKGASTAAVCRGNSGTGLFD